MFTKKKKDEKGEDEAEKQEKGEEVKTTIKEKENEIRKAGGIECKRRKKS